jgi:hypothetical protein
MQRSPFNYDTPRFPAVARRAELLLARPRAAAPRVHGLRYFIRSISCITSVTIALSSRQVVIGT